LGCEADCQSAGRFKTVDAELVAPWIDITARVETPIAPSIVIAGWTANWRGTVVVARTVTIRSGVEPE
jgi:hypothetical protein